MIAQTWNRIKEAEKELARVDEQLANCWNLNDYVILKKKKEKLQEVIDLNKILHVRLEAALTTRHTKIRGYDK